MTHTRVSSLVWSSLLHHLEKPSSAGKPAGSPHRARRLGPRAVRKRSRAWERSKCAAPRATVLGGRALCTAQHCAQQHSTVHLDLCLLLLVHLRLLLGRGLSLRDLSHRFDLACPAAFLGSKRRVRSHSRRAKVVRVGAIGAWPTEQPCALSTALAGSSRPSLCYRGQWRGTNVTTINRTT